jgi:hypothetical protein
MVNSEIYTEKVLPFVGKLVKVEFVSPHSPDVFGYLHKLKSRTMTFGDLMKNEVQFIELKDVKSLSLIETRRQLEIGE